MKLSIEFDDKHGVSTSTLSDVTRIDLDAKDIYAEIQKYLTLAMSQGSREFTVWFMDDDFKFGHVKPIIDRLSSLLELSIHAEGSSFIRTHIVISW